MKPGEARYERNAIFIINKHLNKVHPRDTRGVCRATTITVSRELFLRRCNRNSCWLVSPSRVSASGSDPKLHAWGIPDTWRAPRTTAQVHLSQCNPAIYSISPRDRPPNRARTCRTIRFSSERFDTASSAFEFSHSLRVP